MAPGHSEEMEPLIPTRNFNSHTKNKLFLVSNNMMIFCRDIFVIYV